MATVRASGWTWLATYAGLPPAAWRRWFLEVIVVDRADELYVDLDAVSYLDSAGVAALVRGYVAAVEWGTTYRVVNAHRQAERTLQGTGCLDALADSEDLGGLLLAVCVLPPTNRPGGG